MVAEPRKKRVGSVGRSTEMEDNRNAAEAE